MGPPPIALSLSFFLNLRVSAGENTSRSCGKAKLGAKASASGGESLQGIFAVAHRVRDQLVRPKNDASGDCKLCLDQVIEWLDHDHLAGHRTD
jgi:hypothetical protein